MSMDMNVVFWKHLFDMPLTLDDLNQVDIYRYNMLQAVMANQYVSTFEADLGSG